MKQIKVNMNKYLSMAALALALLAAGCSKNVAPDGEEAAVCFTLETPQIGTKSVADGQSVNSVRCIAYRDGRLIEHGDVTKTVPMSGGKATYETRLIIGQTYKLVFWAEVKGNAHYSFDYQDAELTVSYAGAGNDESRDAFYKVVEVTVADNPAPQTVTLKRPFAQLNYGLSAADKALADAVSPIVKASVKLDDAAYTKMNLLSGEMSGAGSVAFPAAPVLEEPLMMQAAGASAPTAYTYLAMNYILVDREVSPNTTLTLYDASDAVVATVPVSLVPLQRNYRTNVVGNLISAPAALNIVVEPSFENDKNVVK